MVDKEKLISCVFVRDPLWNKINKNHHNSLVLTKLWMEVAGECGTTVRNVKGRWKRLRETFFKKIVEMPVKHSEDGVEDYDTEACDWAYFKSLMFLKNQCVPRKSSGNVFTENSETFNAITDDLDYGTETPSVDEVTSDNKFQILASYSCKDVSREASPSPYPTSMHSSTPLSMGLKKQKMNEEIDPIGEDFLRVEQEKIEYLKRKEKNETKAETDEDEAFFKSIMPYVKALNVKQKIQFRIQIMQLIDAMV